MTILQNLLGSPRTFEGGLFLADHKSATARRPIETIHADPQGPGLFVPLAPRSDLPTRPIVSPGTHVLGGQCLAEAVGVDSIPIHAPTSGHIKGFSRVWSPVDGFLPCAVLMPDGRNDFITPATIWADESFVGQLAERGVFCSQPRMAAHTFILQAARAGVTELIVNAMETEPYLSSDLRTIVEEPGRIIDMIGEFADALGAHRAILALPNRHRRVVKRIQAEAAGRHIDIVSLTDKYPQCHPVLLVKSILDREVEPGQSVLDIGACVLPLQVVRAAAEAWLNDRPITHAQITVSGTAALHSGVYRVPIGTPISQLIDRVGTIARVEQVIWGGPLTGVALGRDDAVVTIDTTAILLMTGTSTHEPVPCIRCGWCVEDCPVGLDPSDLMQLEAEPSITAIEGLHLQACIDCGLCSHVCPAELPIAAVIKRRRNSMTTSALPVIDAAPAGPAAFPPKTVTAKERA